MDIVSGSVALVEPVGSHGGMDYYDSGLCAGLASNKVKAVWYSCDVSEVRGCRSVELVRSFRQIWGDSPAWRRGLRYLKGLFDTYSDARARKIGVAHFHVFHVGVLEALSVALARLFGLRSVVTVHDVEAFKPGGKSRLLESLAYRLSARLVVHNQVSREGLLRRCGVSNDKIRIVPHGSYLGLIEPSIPKDDARRQLGLPERGEKILLFFGQIKEVKGLDLLLEAFGRVRARIGPCRLVIAGKVWKDDFSRYQALIDQHTLDEFVDLRIRYIPDSEVSAFYSAADLIVLPYRRIYQSGVLLMAMSFGVPVLASDLPGMVEIVEDGRNGFLFKAGDVDDLGDRIVFALDSKGARDAVVLAAAHDMETRFSWDSIGKDLRDVYREALGSNE